MKNITPKKQQCSRTPWHEVTTPWRRAENWWRGDAAVCVSAKTRFQTSRAASPLCGIVWPLPGSQGIKSSLQSPNLDFPLFRSVILPITKYWATCLVWRNITFINTCKSCDVISKPSWDPKYFVQFAVTGTQIWSNIVPWATAGVLALARIM